MTSTPTPTVSWPACRRGYPQVTSLVVSATLLGAVVVFLRSATRGTVWSVDREIQLRRLLQLHGHLRLPGLLRHPPRQVGDLLPGGRAAITYRVKRRGVHWPP